MANIISRVHAKWIVGILCLSMLLGVAGFISPVASAHSIGHLTTGHAHPNYGACYYTPNDWNCDGQDPIVQGCNRIAQHLGGDPWNINVYYAGQSGHCNSNYAYVIAPNGVLQEVDFYRSDGYDLSYFPNTRTWETDLIYAPSEQVQVCIFYTGGGAACSIWH